ncbi:hypothetical protein D3C85_1234350 [compost metagenome]
MSEHFIFNINNYIVKSVGLSKACTRFDLDSVRLPFGWVNFDDTVMVAVNRQLITSRQHPLAQNTTKRTSVEHERLVIIEACRYGTFRR